MIEVLPPLNLAALCGKEDIVKLLVAKNKCQNKDRTKNINSSLHLAAKQG